MPELPEVETIRRGLDREVVGKRVKTVQVTGTRTVRRQPKKQFVKRLEGAKITGAEAVIHLGMSGQLLRAQAREPAPKHTHVVITFTQGGQLRYVDPRTFGELFVTTPDELG